MSHHLVWHCVVDIDLPMTCGDGVPQARELLDAVALQVQPILRRRKWTVPQLSEFYPRQSNLLVRRGAPSIVAVP